MTADEFLTPIRLRAEAIYSKALADQPDADPELLWLVSKLAACCGKAGGEKVMGAMK